MTALPPETVETLAEAIHRSRCGCRRGPHDGHKDVALALAPTVAALIAQHVEAARAEGEQAVRERVEALNFESRRLGMAFPDPWREGWNSALHTAQDDLRAALATPDPEAAG